MGLLNLYFSRSRKKIHILIRNRISKQKDEIDFYKKFSIQIVFYIKVENGMIVTKFWINSEILYSHIHIGIWGNSKKKSSNFSTYKSFEYHFGWPFSFNNIYNFFSAKNLSYIEVRRVLDNVYNCNQNFWDRKYYRMMKDQMYLDLNNKKLIKVINNILEN